MANELLDKALTDLERAVEAVRTAAEYAPEAAGAVAHGVSGGAIDPFVFRLAIFVLSIFVGYAIVIWAASVSPMGGVSALRESSVVVAAILGWLFLDEQLGPRRLAACLVVAAGAACLGMRG